VSRLVVWVLLLRGLEVRLKRAKIPPDRPAMQSQAELAGLRSLIAILCVLSQILRR